MENGSVHLYECPQLSATLLSLTQNSVGIKEDRWKAKTRLTKTITREKPIETIDLLKIRDRVFFGHVTQSPVMASSTTD